MALLVAGASHASGPAIGWGSSVPPSVDGTDGAASALAAGPWHSCAIQAQTGHVVCWGYDYYVLKPRPLGVDPKSFERSGV